MNAPLIGARIERKEDYRFLTGAGQYTDDVTLPRQAHAAFIRSPHAHARIKSIDARQARKGAIGAPPAVMNAITDALGVKDIAMPATAQTVWRSMQRTA
jgi:carbon-monoxide dehydrogenase large subunit